MVTGYTAKVHSRRIVRRPLLFTPCSWTRNCLILDTAGDLRHQPVTGECKTISVEHDRGKCAQVEVVKCG